MTDPKRRLLINLGLGAASFLGASILIFGSLLLRSYLEWHIASLTDSNDSTPTDTGSIFGPETLTPEPPDEPTSTPTVSHAFIDLQPIVDQWIETYNLSSRAGVMIYDLDHSRTAANYHADEVFDVASVYKLLFAYDGYRQIALGAQDPDAYYTHTAEKGDLTYAACLDLIIRESYNGCADRLASNSANVARVEGLIREFAMTSTSNFGLRSTAADLTRLLRAYWRHSDLPEDLWARLADSMLDQPPAAGDSGDIYDWRQGLPAGFSSAVDVYNKVGWEWDGEATWNVYTDAAIIDFTELDRHYTVVVLTRDLPSHTIVSRLGYMIEDYVTLNSIAVQ